MNRQHALGETLRSGQLDGGLRARVLGRAESLSGPSWLVSLIEDGQAILSSGEDPIAAPALVWRPWKPETRAQFAPGVRGGYVILGSSVLASVIGHLPEARDLRELVDHDVTIDLSEESRTLETLRSAFRELHSELRTDDPGARSVVDAYLRIVLFNLYRLWLARQAFRETVPSSHHAFARFSNLVEVHFRERWTVNDYARRLGMTRDRLGDVCKRARGLGPKDLIDRRVALEARLQLEGSSLSIQQVSALLGFTSSPQFTRFFKRATGVAPGQYRRQSEHRRDVPKPGTSVHYEWP